MAIAPDLKVYRVFQCNHDLSQTVASKSGVQKYCGMRDLRMSTYWRLARQVCGWHIRVLFPLVTPADIT